GNPGSNRCTHSSAKPSRAYQAAAAPASATRRIGTACSWTSSMSGSLRPAPHRCGASPRSSPGAPTSGGERDRSPGGGPGRDRRKGGGSAGGQGVQVGVPQRVGAGGGAGGGLGGAGAQPLRRPRGGERGQGAGQVLRVAGGAQQAVGAVAHRVRQGPGAGGDHREAVPRRQQGGLRGGGRPV